MNPSDPETAHHAYSARLRAHRFLEAERYVDAERASREGLAQNPDDSELYLTLARSLFLQERLEEAREEAQEALRLQPDSPRTLCMLGSILSRSGQNVAAEEQYLEALRIDPQDPTILLVYGALLHQTGHLDKAATVLRHSLSQDPENSSTHALLSLVLAEGDKSDARLHSEKSLHLGPDEDMPHFAQGIALLKRGHPFKARKHLREALRLDPSDEVTEESFLEADRACRWIYMPMYFWSLVIERLPGQQFLVWGIFVALIWIGPGRTGTLTPVLGAAVISYAVFCIYTWFSSPLANLWIRWFPPK